METKEINNKEQWDGFLKVLDADFLQSWEWGEILRASGQKIKRLAVVENCEIIAQTLVVYKAMPFGWRYAFSPRGPIIKNVAEAVNNFLADYFKKNNCVFWRIEPAELMRVGAYTIKKVRDINPEATMVIDITKSEEEILSVFHSKTRYNIKLAQKKKLEIKIEKNLTDFWQLMQQTGARDNFGLHPKKNYASALSSPAVYQRTVYYNGAPVACGCFFAFNDTLYYLYGASNYAWRHLMAPYLIQWEGIKLAKQLGLKKYDLFGVAPGRMENGHYVFNEQHRYVGVTKFKQGFNGQYIFYPGTFDLILNKTKYSIYSALRWLRRIL